MDYSATQMPSPPAVGHSVDWSAVMRAWPQLGDLAGCAQDPFHHAEGDALIHTQLVVEALIADPAWQRLDRGRREELFWAALLHDIAKPLRSRVEDGRIISPGHSRLGAIMARELLWRSGLDPERRERVAQLVRHHMVPAHLYAEEDPRLRLATISWTTSCRDLLLLARADVRGRRCADHKELEERVELFGLAAEEHGCLAEPYPFTSDHARFVFFRAHGEHAPYAAYDDTRCELTIMSALPGAGKDTWIAQRGGDLPVVSLDDLRIERQVRRGNQRAEGRAVQEARKMLKAHLRAGSSCIWNATNITRQMRTPLIDLAHAYKARVRIVSVEAPAAEIYRQNAGRAHSVPNTAIDKLAAKWEAPDLTECHQLIVAEGS